MATQTAHTSATSAAPVAFDNLASRLTGAAWLPGSPEYEESRRLQNGLIDRRPAVIVHCEGTADVVQAVTYAREHDLHLSVRCGGHNVSGNAMNDGGVAIDMRGMRSVHVDTGQRIVRAEGGATWGDVDRQTSLFGLAVPGGVVSTTGIGGLTLHGGLGHLRRKHGLSIDNLLEVEIVTADGNVLTANDATNADLFWAVRGAGSNFGVITYRAHPVGPLVHLTAPVYALDDAEQVVAGWREFVSTAPDEVSSLALFWSVPSVDAFPAEHHGTPIFIPAAVYAGDPADGARILQPLRELAQPLFDLTGEMPYTTLQAAFDPFFPRGRLYYWKSSYIDELSDDAIGTMIEQARQRPSGLSSVTFWHLGGAISRISADATAYWRSEAPYLLTAESSWDDPDQNATNIAWSRDTLAALEPYTHGGLYLNFAGFGEEKDSMLRSTFGHNYQRLVEVKRRYDPGNLFHMNVNIVP